MRQIEDLLQPEIIREASNPSHRPAYLAGNQPVVSTCIIVICMMWGSGIWTELKKTASFPFLTLLAQKLHFLPHASEITP